MTPLRKIILVSMFTSITIIFSLVLIPLPFTPVPVTLQIMVISFSASILGPKLALISQGLYTLLGILGLPVFAGGTSGLQVLLGPTGGYLFGFMAGAFIIGFLTKTPLRLQLPANSRLLKIPGGLSFLQHLIAMSIGLMAVYLFGALQLMVYMNLTLHQAFLAGALPFLLPDFMKVIMAATLSVILKERLTKARYLENGKALS